MAQAPIGGIHTVAARRNIYLGALYGGDANYCVLAVETAPNSNEYNWVVNWTLDEIEYLAERGDKTPVRTFFEKRIVPEVETYMSQFNESDDNASEETLVQKVNRFIETYFEFIENQLRGK